MNTTTKKVAYLRGDRFPVSSCYSHLVVDFKTAPEWDMGGASKVGWVVQVDHGILAILNVNSGNRMVGDIAIGELDKLPGSVLFATNARWYLAKTPTEACSAAWMTSVLGLRPVKFVRTGLFLEVEVV